MTVIRRLLAIGLFVVLLVAGWSFAHGNPQAVPIDYLLGTTAPLAVWKIVSAAVFFGMALAGLYLGLALLKDRVEIRRLQRALRKLEDELRDFRNKPIEADLAELHRLPDDVPTVADAATGRGR
jgi:uncharacterized membrane protein YciS (DUF1049 family)